MCANTAVECTSHEVSFVACPRTVATCPVTADTISHWLHHTLALRNAAALEIYTCSFLVLAFHRVVFSC